MKIRTNDQKVKLNPRQTNVSVTQPSGETVTGKDSQPDMTVRELSGQIGGK